MKKYIFYKVAKHVSRNKSYYEEERRKKKLKYFVGFAALAVFGAVIFGGIAIWGAAALATNIASSINPTIEEIVANGKKRLTTITSQPITTKDCLDTVSSVISPSTLLTAPLAQNFDSVRSACWDGTKVHQNNQNNS